MTEYGLDPAFVRIFYHTAFGQHVHTFPTLEWSGGLGTNGNGGYTSHAGGVIDAQDMIIALVTELLDFQPPSATYDSAIIYTQADPDAPALPVSSLTLNLDGTAATADVPASQATLTARTEGFHIAKITWFDAAPSTDFLPLRALPVSGQPLDLFNEWSGITNAWAGRDGERPSQFIQVAYTLNEALRKQYRLN